MAVDPGQHDRPVADRGVELGGGGEAAQPPLLLVPAAAQDPRPVGVGGGIGADPRLRLGEAVRVRQVERQHLEAEVHQVAVAVDKAGQQHPPLHVGAPVEPLGPLVDRRQQADHLAVGGEQQAGEADDVPVGVQGDPGDVVDQRSGGGDRRGRRRRVALGGGGERQDAEGKRDQPG